MASNRARSRNSSVYAFVDTNIFLDFYRAKTEASLSLFEKLTKVKDKVICTYQVHMEFLKNRQEQIKNIANNVDLRIDASLPSVLSGTHIDGPILKTRDRLKAHKKKLEERIFHLLDDPRKYDPIYSTLENIFTSESGHVLTRDMNVRHIIKRLAWRRFILGYPPRKSKDTSIGDALNWEWFIHCAQQLPGRFIIVSRDSDFGCEFHGECFLNEALKNEFRDRVGKKSVTYTNKLSYALKELSIPVTKAEVNSETEEFDLGPLAKSIGDINENWKRMMETIGSNIMQNQKINYDNLKEIYGDAWPFKD